MNYLVCQDNFVGFLSAVYDSYYLHKNTDTITSDKNDCNLLDIYTSIDEDVEKAQKVRGGIIKKGGMGAFNKICDAYRSGNKNKEQIIYDYLKLFFAYGRDADERFSDAAVIKFNDLISKVYHEIHRISAFIRLQEMSNGIYYGFYSSDNDILEKLMPNLTPQFNTMKFIIHDYKRNKMAFFDGENCSFAVAPDKIEIELSEQEIFFQKIWKQYFETVSIKERKNERQQNAFLPKKYRHFMLEF